ncbi:MAG: UDP-N-acetylmuramate dehydrogenase [Clostridia bacterium]|nr:UDP-N-acetylmuramate dehydrogenase [Clostridia bacterium]MBR5747139.1 UDP-N-acetylmuramate dehydrogenase [Clostridia bacterium]
MSFTVKENSPLAPLTWMRVGGNAKYLVFPRDTAGLAEALRRYTELGERVITVGNCSNIIFPDSGFDGAVIVTTGVKGIALRGGVINAACGETLSSLARFAANNSLAGLEFCYGIPGTVGGGIFMNAGAYGGELSQRVKECALLDENLQEITLSAEELDFGYRKSAVAEKGYTVLSAFFVCEKGDRKAIFAQMDELMSRRKASQPLEYPSCGSTFKRPAGHYAGALIEQCGLKGVSVGGAEVSQKHAGFIINKNNAAASDVLALIKLVTETVREQTGVTLEPEVRIIGAEE